LSVSSGYDKNSVQVEKKMCLTETNTQQNTVWFINQATDAYITNINSYIAIRI